MLNVNKVNSNPTMKKRKRKASKDRTSRNKREQKETSEENVPKQFVPPIRKSDEPVPRRGKWINKQRVLIISARNITFRNRHLMNDLRTILPHSKSENKIEKKSNLTFINEVAEMRNCKKCIYFESRKHTDLYMWMVNVTHGPSIKFLVENVHTMTELKLTGNCLKGSRPLVCFDKSFDEPHWIVMKELLLQVFSTPKGHPKSQPFFDHVFVFSLIDNKIWFRNYQIVEEDGQLTEIGPRFVLNPIKLFGGSFGGETLWSNPSYVTPNKFRINKKKIDAQKYVNTVNQMFMREVRTNDQAFTGDPTEEFFETKPPEEAKGKEKQVLFRKKLK